MAFRVRLNWPLSVAECTTSSPKGSSRASASTESTRHSGIVSPNCSVYCKVTVRRKALPVVTTRVVRKSLTSSPVPASSSSSQGLGCWLLLAGDGIGGGLFHRWDTWARRQKKLADCKDTPLLICQHEARMCVLTDQHTPFQEPTTMPLLRRQLALAALAIACGCAIAPAGAQTAAYPAKPITVIV